VAFCAESYYHYRFSRGGSAMSRNSGSRQVRVDRHLAMIEDVLAFWRDHRFIKGYETDLLAWMVELIYPDLPHLSRALRMQYAVRVREIIKDYGLPATASSEPTAYELRSILRGGSVVSKALHRLHTKGFACLGRSMVGNAAGLS